MPKYDVDPLAERVVSRQEFENLDISIYVETAQASELSNIPRKTIQDRARRGQYRYIRCSSNGKMAFYREDFDPESSKRAHKTRMQSLDDQMKSEKVRKLKRENDEAEGVLIQKSEVQVTCREVFRLMFGSCRETIDKWGITYGLTAKTTHEMSKDFDKVIKEAAEKLGKHYNF